MKTRLTPPLSPEQACALYERMLDDVLELSARAASRLDLEPVLAVHPPESRAELAARAPKAFRTVAQRGRGLSERMAHAVDEAAAAGAQPILLRGSDSPALDESTLETAVRALEVADLVVCPDRDGGYNLIGVRRCVPGLFRHRMSTESVLDDTLANAAAAGLRSEVLEPGFDIDVAADLKFLAEARRREAPPCPRTLAFLDETGLWGACEGS